MGNTGVPVEVLAEMGVLMLLFLVGMELSLRGFKAIWKVAVGATLGSGAVTSMLTNAGLDVAPSSSSTVYSKLSGPM